MDRVILPPPSGSSWRRPALRQGRDDYQPWHAAEIRSIELLLDAGDRALARRDYASATLEFAAAALAAYMERERATNPRARRRYHGLMLFANARLPAYLQQSGSEAVPG